MQQQLKKNHWPLIGVINHEIGPRKYVKRIKENHDDDSRLGE